MRLKRTLLIFSLVLLAPIAVSVDTRPVTAAIGGPGVCGTSCMAGGGMFRPFYGTPYYPVQAYYNPYQTGQMSYYGPYNRYPTMDLTPVYISNSINYNGAQPLGYSYMPPIGASAVMNSLMYGQMAQ